MHMAGNPDTPSAAGGSVHYDQGKRTTVYKPGEAEALAFSLLGAAQVARQQLARERAVLGEASESDGLSEAGTEADRRAAELSDLAQQN